MPKQIIPATDEYCRKLVRDLYSPATIRTPKINVLPEDYELLKRSESLDHGFQKVMAFVQDRGIAADAGVDKLEQYVASKLLFLAVQNDNNPEVELFLVKAYGADPRTEDLDTEDTALTCAMLQRKDYSVVNRLCRYVSTPQELNGDFNIIGSILCAFQYFDDEDLISVLRLAYHDIDLFFPPRTSPRTLYSGKSQEGTE
jgi:hypothetical protein